MIAKWKIALLSVSALASASGVAMAQQSTGEFKDAIKSAYETNPRIKAQRRVMETSNERVSQSISNWLPSLSATYNNGRQRTRFDNPNWSHEGTESRQLNFNQPIFSGGANFSRYSSTKELMYAGRENLKQLEQEVLFDAVVVYMDVVQAQTILELSKNNELVLRKQLASSNDRFSVGDVTRTDVAQSEARLARSESDLISAKGDVQSTAAQFERVVGYAPEGVLPYPTEFPEIPATLEEVVDQAKLHNPRVNSSEHLAESADDDIYTNVAALLPKVAIVGSMSRQDGAGVTGASSFDHDQIGVNVTVPIYQNGSEYSRVREAKLVAKRREFELRDSEDAIREAAIQAWENLETSIATIESTDKAVESAEIAVDGVNQEQQYGARTVLDVLDAEQELFVARVNAVRAKRNRAVAVFNVLQVMGKLNPSYLEVDTKIYDPEEHYNDVKWQVIGF